LKLYTEKHAKLVLKIGTETFYGCGQFFSRIVDMIAEMTVGVDDSIQFNDGWSDGEVWEMDAFNVADLDVREYERSHVLTKQLSFILTDSKSKRSRGKKSVKEDVSTVEAEFKEEG